MREISDGIVAETAADTAVERLKSRVNETETHSVRFKLNFYRLNKGYYDIRIQG